MNNNEYWNNIKQALKLKYTWLLIIPQLLLILKNTDMLTDANLNFLNVCLVGALEIASIIGFVQVYKHIPDKTESDNNNEDK